MDNHNLALTLCHHGIETPNAIAICCDGRSLTYADLAQRAAQLARFLRESPEWNVNRGHPPRIGVLAQQSIEAYVALLGTCWAGGTYVPISTSAPPERIAEILARCSLAAIVVDTHGASLLAQGLLDVCPPLVVAPDRQALSEWRGGVINVVSTDALPPDRVPEPMHVGAGHPAYIIFTSGTTGTPKGVVIPAGAARHYIDSASGILGLTSDDRVLETSEPSFDASVHNMFSTWEAGASLYVLPKHRAMNAVKFAVEARLTVWNSVPSLVGMLRQLKSLRPGVLPDIRIAAFGGEQLSAGIVDAWRVAAPNSMIHNLYGPTETTVYCLNEVVGKPTPLTPGRDVVAIGRPLPGNLAAVFSDTGEMLADGEPGELGIGGPQLAIGYLDAPELTAQRFPTRAGTRWYLTGDRVVRDTSGTLHYLGRVDNQVKVLGHRVELEEVEAHLRIVAGADLVGAVGWPHDGEGTRGIVAFVAGDAIDTAQARHEMARRLPAYMVPSRIVALSGMPLNRNGKVDRHALLHLLEREICQ
ncbi:amino acid adenylation domain-containing protein [Paraburkholderia fungorum]|uniref:amino acid adenylation domain-containing protein n=1 Tax=Paraburkholderia fungorum TaxID=134537 RepID=UPI0038BBFE33